MFNKVQEMAVVRTVYQVEIFDSMEVTELIKDLAQVPAGALLIAREQVNEDDNSLLEVLTFQLEVATPLPCTNETLPSGSHG